MTLERDLDRRARIIRLLQTRDDGLPEARWSGTPSAERGFIHETIVRESCSDCLANGVILRGCETCHGEGFIEYRRLRDPYATDKVVPYGITPDKHERARARDLEIDRLAMQTLPPPASELDIIDAANAHPERWEIERRRMYKLFDYHLLDRALDILRQRDQQSYHLVHGIHVYGWIEPSTTVEVAVERGLRTTEGLIVAWIKDRPAKDGGDTIRAPGFDIVKHPAQQRWERRNAA